MDLSIIANVLDASGLDALQASDGLEQLSLPTVRDSRNPQYLSAKGRERHVVELRDPLVIPHGEVIHKDALDGVHWRGPLDVERHLMANHHVGHLLGSRLGGDHLAHVLSLAKHHHAVADFLHLVELVGDDDDGLAVVTHIAKNGKELLGLLRGEHGRGLVKDEDVHATVYELDNLYRLLLGDAHLVDLLVGVDVEAIGLTDSMDLLGGCL